MPDPMVPSSMEGWEAAPLPSWAADPVVPHCAPVLGEALPMVLSPEPLLMAFSWSIEGDSCLHC